MPKSVDGPESAFSRGMLNFCTLFDSKYLARGLVMIDSLQRMSPGATVYVLCMNELAECYLRTFAPTGVVPIGLKEFETEALLAAKRDRSKAEYCWTCTPAIILHCISRYQLDGCTYVDADLFFYRDPAGIFERMGARSILITPHRYSEGSDQTETSGRYCVQFMAFRATPAGLAALTWWHDRCLEWCYARAEEGKFGDQKYLDDWPTRFADVYVADEADMGVAPWNIQQYQVEGEMFAASHTLRMRSQAAAVAPFFYHFHGVRFWRDGLIDFGTNYRISPGAKAGIYQPYLAAVMELNRRQLGPHPDLREAMYERAFKNRRLLLKTILWMLRGTRNIVRINPSA